MHSVENKSDIEPEIVGHLRPMHPGEVLREEFLRPYGLSAGRVAKACHLPRTRIERIVREELGVTADTAVRLAAYFGTSAKFWLNLQAGYEAAMAEAELAGVAATIVPLNNAA